MSILVKKAIVKVSWTCLGRRNLVRLARFLNNEARLDVPNNMATNGESLVQEIVCRNALPESELVIFDVGANIGEWTERFLGTSGRYHRSSHVHAFEACKGTCEILTNRFWSDDLTRKVSIVGKALSDHPGMRVLVVSSVGAGTNSLDTPDGSDKATHEEVESTTIDEYCRQHGIDSVTFLKIDTEGHDLFVMKGASSMLRRRAIEVLQFEYNHRWIYSRSYLRDVFELFRTMGYRIGKVTPKGIEFYHQWDPELETFREGNYLACLEEWTSKFPKVLWWNQRQNTTLTPSETQTGAHTHFV